MPEHDEILAQLRDARAESETSSREAHAARLEHIALLREKERVERKGDREQLGAIEGALRESRVKTRSRDELQVRARRNVAELVAGLHESLSVESLTTLWSSEMPILLLPLRVETRFKGSQLLVRVFPDEISVDSHEELPTEGEAAAGQAYWKTLAVDPSETSRKEAWRKLVDAFKAPRAAYVIKRTKPTNWEDVATVGAGGLAFPLEPVLKKDSWTQPPLVKVLPDRLVLTLWRNGKQTRPQIVGELIPDSVQAGPTPLTSDGTASWKRGPDGKLVFDAETEWLRDFDRAVEMGLGFRVALEPGDEAGFSELLVLGLKHSADLEETEARVSELLIGHRYSPKGLALVPQGTATNNTSSEDAGFDTIDWFADVSFAAERAGERSESPAQLDEASDGWRLAAYLGLDPAVFAGLPHSGQRDHAEAVALNAALYPGTLGYFLRTMVGEVASESRLDELRRLFTHSVTGRGPLAALRVGNQPYGIVLAGPAPSAPAEGGRGSIDLAVSRVIARARKFWIQKLPELKRLGTSANGSDDLLAVLGVQPTTGEYFQRIATTYDHLSNLAGFQTQGDRMDDVFAAMFAGSTAGLTLHDLGYDGQRPDGTHKPYPLLFQLIYQRHQTLIPQSSLIDGQPFSESETIKPYDAGKTKNYIDWLAANARNANALRRQDFDGANKPTALLYMLLRHALLIQAGTSVNRWLKLFEIDAPELVTSRKFLGMTPAVDVAAWEILSAPASAVAGAVKSSLPLLAIVQLPEYRSGIHASIGAPLDEMLGAYGVLRGLPTARLERLLAEHIDTLSYRLDAWETALIDRRLVRRREGQESGSPRRGLYLGAVGYLENVQRAEGRRVAISEKELHESLREGKGDLYRPTDAAGFVHGPSLNHATAAAVLRNGYLTHATADDPQRLAVNLSSRRVRRSKELMDGVRNGQPLEVLLGIEFERGMHDATTRAIDPVVLNDLKPIFRAAFPIRRTRIPKAGHPGDEPTIVPDFSVVNGLDVIAADDTFPTGVKELPALSARKSAELRAIRERLRDSVDALKDVVTAETAYQLALGNFDRSAAVVQSLSAALAPAEIEVTQSSRGTDLAFTQRLSIEFDPAVVGNPWAPIALTPRARLELPLNAWLGALLGDPTKFACKVTLSEPNAAPVQAAVRLSDLRLQPLDLLHVTRGVRDASGPQELEARIHAAALATSGASRAATVQILFGETGSADPSVAAMSGALALFDLAHQVIAGARPIDGRDALTASKPLPKGTEPSGVDVDELRTRFNALQANASQLVLDLATSVSNAKAPGAPAGLFDALRVVLRRAADAGVPFAFPAGPDETLIAHGETIATALAALRDRAATLESESQLATLTPPQAAEKLIAAVQQLLGADFRVMPRYTAPNAPELAASDATRDAMLATARGGDMTLDPVSEVLTSVAAVRLAVSRLHRLRLAAELMTGNQPTLTAIQLPPRADDVWLGAALPPDHVIADDTLSLIQLRAQGFAPGALRCGLLVDEWTESFPRKTEVTGLTFGFDQPNSAPLQSLLLAVAGDDQQSWSWERLLAIVRDTILRAKLRAVEPDMLDTIPGVTTLVPATMAEFSTSPGALSLDFGLSVPAILREAMSSTYWADHRTAETNP